MVLCEIMVAQRAESRITHWLQLVQILSVKGDLQTMICLSPMSLFSRKTLYLEDLFEI
jgi:hypothetical protein